MNLDKKISVMVCCYNVADYLDTCMEKLLNQTIGLQNIEILLVDDGSNDGKTIEKLREYARSYPQNIVLIENGTNLGLGASRNKALNYASGEYLAYCDADDWFSLDAFETLYKAGKDNNADVVEFKYMDVYTLDGNCIKEARDTGKCKVTQIDLREKRREFALPPDSSVVVWTRIYRTDFLKENNIKLTESVTYEEPEFTYIIRLLEKIHVDVDQTFYYYYQRPGSNSDKYYKYIEEVWKSYIGYIKTAKDKGIYEANRDEIDFTYWCGLFYLPMLNLAAVNTFYTKEQYKKIQKLVGNEIGDIRCNPYWKHYFAVYPVLGDLTYVDIERINIEDIKELFVGLAKG